jgi:hypothetical protein
MWQPGDHVVLRFDRRALVTYVTPCIVVEDSEETIALYVAVDTPVKKPFGLDGHPIPRELTYTERQNTPWRLGDGRWTGRSVLWITTPGERYSVGLFWEGADRSFVGWYVNLQDPLRRSSVGFDTADHILDITVAPDRTWEWKDEDEFAEAIEHGRFTLEEAARIRATGEAVIALMKRDVWPFQSTAAEWRPDPSWTIPTMPSNWDDPIAP